MQVPQDNYVTDKSQSLLNKELLHVKSDALQCKGNGFSRQKFPLWQLPQEERLVLDSHPLSFAWAISALFFLHTLFWRSGYPISHHDSPTLQINVICLLTAEYQMPPRKVTDPQHAWKTCKHRHFLTALDSCPHAKSPRMHLFLQDYSTVSHSTFLQNMRQLCRNNRCSVSWALKHKSEKSYEWFFREMEPVG